MNISHPIKGADGINTLLLKLILHGASRSGELQDESHLAFFQGKILDEAQGDDICIEIGV